MGVKEGSQNLKRRHEIENWSVGANSKAEERAQKGNHYAINCFMIEGCHSLFFVEKAIKIKKHIQPFWPFKYNVPEVGQPKTIRLDLIYFLIK